MSWLDLATHTAALLLYPGLLVTALAGLPAEALAAWALADRRRGWGRAARRVATSLRPTPGHPAALPPLAATAALLVLVAATQLAAPLSPVPGSERNLLPAVVALAGAAWLTWAWGWERPGCDPGLLLMVQGCWLVSVLGPVIALENLRPQVLGTIVVPALLPLKLACAVLYLLCLPVLLHLAAEAAPQGLPGHASPAGPSLEQAGFTAVRVLLWLPYCGLFASVFLPPGDDLAGLARFAGGTVLAALAAVGLGVLLRRSRAHTARRLYLRLVVPFAVFTLGVSILAALVT